MSAFIAGASILVLAAAFWAYHNTIPSISGRLRVALTVARSAVLLFLIILVLDPRCVRNDEIIEKPVVVSLIDKSTSMNLTSGRWNEEMRMSRFKLARELSQRLKQEVETRGGEIREFSFADDLYGSLGDSAQIDGQGTNIRRSLLSAAGKLEGRNLRAIVLFSDGIETGSPIKRTDLPDVPVFSIGLGDTDEPEDVRIKSVDYNSIVRIPSRARLRAVIEGKGKRSKRAILKLKEGRNVLFEDNILIDPAGGEIARDIMIDVPEPGRRRMVLTVDIDENDTEPENNRRDIVIDAVKSDVKILIIDMFPGWDLHFITDLLRDQKTYSFDLIRGRGLALREPEEKRSASLETILKDYDALILLSFDDKILDKKAAESVIDFVEKDGKGLMVFPGRHSLFDRSDLWREMQEILPLRLGAGARFNFSYTAVVPGRQTSPDFIISGMIPILSQVQWQERAPLLGYYAPITALEKSQVLLEVKNTGVPALAYKNAGRGRTAVLAAGPIWRWRFLTDGSGVYETLMLKMLDIISRGESAGRFSLVFKKNVFQTGEKIDISAEVFDDKMLPVAGVPVSVEVSRYGRNGEELPLEEISLKRERERTSAFKASLPSLAPGVYKIRGKALLAGGELLSTPAEITVSEISVEFRSTAQDMENLAAIAAATGGAYADASGMREVTGELPLYERRSTVQSELRYRTSAAIFVLVLLLLSIEWIARKRAGMI